MTGSRYEDTYCGVANINTVRTAFFLEDINYLEVDSVDFVNAYIHGMVLYFSSFFLTVLHIPKACS